MPAPYRIQLRRTKGWRLPPGTVVVSRPSRWGNPFRVTRIKTADEAVTDYKEWLHYSQVGQFTLAAARIALRGRNLACWCPIGSPCHADILLAEVNRPDR